MKAFIAGVITLSLLISAITVNSFFILKKTDDIIDEIKELPQSVSEADDAQLQRVWKKSHSWIALTVHRENVDEIEDTLSQLRIEISEQNDIGYLREKEHLLTIAKRLKKTESFSLSRIF